MEVGADRVAEVWQRVLAADPAMFDLTTARARVADTRWLAAFVSARQASFTTALERLEREAVAAQPAAEPASAAEPQSAVEPDETLRLPPESSEETERRRSRAGWLQRCVLFAAALEQGRVTDALVDALVSALKGVEPPVVAHVLAEEAGLVELAGRMTPAGFRAAVRRRIDHARADFGESVLQRQRKDSKASTWIDRHDGMYHLSVALDPERGQVLLGAITQRVGELRNQPTDRPRSEGDLRLQAVIDLIAGTAHAMPEVLVVVDERTVRSGPHPHSMCETEAGVTLPPSVVINLCADAKVTAAIVNADGAVVAAGCVRRIATREQRRMLRAMYRACAHPDCSVPFTECVMHHVIHFEHGGPTAIANLLPLCFRHHHLVHEGGWNVAIDTGRTLCWYRPDGTLERTTELLPLLDRPDLRPIDDRPVAATHVGGPARGRAPPRRVDPSAA